MRVRISAGGRDVELSTDSDTNVSVHDVAAEALAVWRATDGLASGMEGPAFGLQADLSTDRAPTSSAPSAALGIVE